MSTPIRFALHIWLSLKQTNWKQYKSQSFYRSIAHASNARHCCRLLLFLKYFDESSMLVMHRSIIRVHVITQYTRSTHMVYYKCPGPVVQCAERFAKAAPIALCEWVRIWIRKNGNRIEQKKSGTRATSARNADGRQGVRERERGRER